MSRMDSSPIGTASPSAVLQRMTARARALLISSDEAFAAGIGRYLEAQGEDMQRYEKQAALDARPGGEENEKVCRELLTDLAALHASIADRASKAYDEARSMLRRIHAQKPPATGYGQYQTPGSGILMDYKLK